jgi:GNAT superfamily N-acetyltransferase
MQTCFVRAGAAAWADIMSADSLQKLQAPERWKDNIYTRSLENGVLVLEAEGLIVGFAVIRPSGDEDAQRATGEIDALYVEPRFWGRGGGRALMEACLAQMREARLERATLWTEERNARPRRFYELQGWRLDGARREREVQGSAIAEVRYMLDW